MRMTRTTVVLLCSLMIAGHTIMAQNASQQHPKAAPQAVNRTITIKYEDGKMAHYKLIISRDTLTDVNGVLKLSPKQFDKLKGSNGHIELIGHFVRSLYAQAIYYTPAGYKSDANLDFAAINIGDLFAKESNTFFVRRKANNLSPAPSE